MRKQRRKKDIALKQFDFLIGKQAEINNRKICGSLPLDTGLKNPEFKDPLLTIF